MTGDDGTKQIRVMIVEDNADFRALMEVLLNAQPDIELVSQAGSLAEARANAAGSEPDVAVLDLGLPGFLLTNRTVRRVRPPCGSLCRALEYNVSRLRRENR